MLSCDAWERLHDEERFACLLQLPALERRLAQHVLTSSEIFRAVPMYIPPQ